MTDKRKRRSAFRKHERALRGLNLIDKNLSLLTISMGVDRNGDGVIIITADRISVKPAIRSPEA